MYHHRRIESRPAPWALTLALAVSVGACRPDSASFDVEEGEAVQANLRPQSDFSLGFAYLAPGHVGGWVAAFDNPALGLEDAFRTDMALLEANGVRYLKVGVTPHWQGFEFREGSRTQIDWGLVDRVSRNLVRIIEIARAHGMEVAITFLFNDLYVHGPNGFVTTPTWYQATYDRIPNGAAAIAEDVVAYETRIVEALASSAVADAVVYYNLFTEARLSGAGRQFVLQQGSWTPMMENLLAQIVTRVPVPAGKLALDVQELESIAHLRAIMDRAGVWLPFTEVHSYPNGAFGDSNGDISGFVQEVRRQLPGTILTLGEFGISHCKNSDEPTAARRFAQLVDDALTAGIPFGFNWGVYDGNPSGGCNTDVSRYGLGYSREAMRDVYGVFVDHAASLPNGDFEAGTAGWFPSANGAVSHVRDNSAFTGRAFLRFTPSSASSSTYFCATELAIASGADVATHFYARTAAQQFFLQLHHRGPSGSGILTKRVSPPPSGGFFSLASVVDDLSFDVPEETTHARLCFTFPAGESSRFDLDAFAITAVRGRSEPPAPTFLRPTVSAGSYTPNTHRVVLEGTNLYPETCVNARIANAPAIVGSYCGADITLAGPRGSTQTLSFVLASAEEQAHISQEGLQFWLVNPGDRNWTTSGALVRYEESFERPSISAGHYDAATDQVVLAGRGFYPETCVNARRDGQDPIIGGHCWPSTTVLGVPGAEQILSFSPTSDAERAALHSDALRVWLVNPGAQNWTTAGHRIVQVGASARFDRPEISSGDYAPVAHQVVLRGTNFYEETCVNIRREGDSAVLSAYCAPRTRVVGAPGDAQVIVFPLASEEERTSISQPGLRFWLVNPGDRNWTTSGLLLRE